MKKDPAVYLKDIIDAIEHVFDFTAGSNWDSKTLYAVERALLIIGEAGNRIPDDVKHLAPDIAWNEIKGLRNLPVHEYEHINTEILKDIRNNHLASLKSSVENLLKKLKG